jgi:hypothetical protein
MSKYSRYYGLLACVALVVATFLPWTWHADVGENFTGFYSVNGYYGKPGKFLIFYAIVAAIFILVPRIWAKRANIFMSALFMGYAIKSYILYTSCYNAYCPEKQPGIFIMMISVATILLASFFPDMKLKSTTKDPG